MHNTTATEASAPIHHQPAARPTPDRFRPTPRMWIYLAAVVGMYASVLVYAHFHGLSISSIFLHGVLQPSGLTGEEARFTEIETPLSWNIPQVLWYVYIKGAAVLVELFQYWVVGMLIAGSLIVFVSWEKIKGKMEYGGLKANLLAASAGAVIPICSCGVVPVLAGMVGAGIPLGPTMAFLIAAPMLNVPTVFITAGVLGWPMALARVVATLGIALAVGQVLARWQRRHRSPRQFLKIRVAPKLSAELQQFAFQFGLLASRQAEGVRPDQLGPDAESQLIRLEEAGIAEPTADGRWRLAQAETAEVKDVGGCAILPEGDVAGRTLLQKCGDMFRMATRLFIQLNGYLLLAVLIAGAIKVVVPTDLVTDWVGGTAMNSVLVASVVAAIAYVCTYVEVPTAMALMSKGMGPGATLAYLLGGPGLSLPSIAMLSGVFRPRVLVLYAGVSFLGCVAAGLLYNVFF